MTSGSANDCQRNRDDRTSEEVQRHDPLCDYSHNPSIAPACAITSTLECVDPAHAYGTATVCLTCFEREVRADEREKAVQRLEATLLHEGWCPLSPFNPYPLPDDVCGCGHCACIAAVGGEAQ